MKIFPPGQSIRIVLIALLLTTCCLSRAQAAVALDPLGRFLTSHGYGGAQLVHPGNYFRVPINSNGRAGDLTIDTGAPTSLIYRASLGKLGLTETLTKQAVGGAFGRGREHFGITKISSLTMGNCTLLNMMVAVASDNEGRGIFRRYGSSDGLLGLREMVRFGAVLDLGNRLLYFRPKGPSQDIGSGTKSILLAKGYAAISFLGGQSHLRVPGAINGMPCRFIVDTGAYLTSIDQDAAYKARIGGRKTRFVARGLGKSGGEISAASFPSLRVGDYEIKNASTAVIHLSDELLGRGTDAEAAGLLGADYLGMNSAVFDFNSRTLYLKAKAKH